MYSFEINRGNRHPMKLFQDSCIASLLCFLILASNINDANCSKFWGGPFSGIFFTFKNFKNKNIESGIDESKPIPYVPPARESKDGYQHIKQKRSLSSIIFGMVWKLEQKVDSDGMQNNVAGMNGTPVMLASTTSIRAYFL